MPDMPTISVSLPVLSTVKLPGAFLPIPRQPAGMDLAVLLTNIERRLKDLKLSSDEASRLAGRPDAIRNLKRKVTNGTIKGSMRADTLAALARVLETSPIDLTRSHETASAPISGLREYLLQQRALIDLQLAELDAQEEAAKKQPKRKIR